MENKTQSLYIWQWFLTGYCLDRKSLSLGSEAAWSVTPRAADGVQSVSPVWPRSLYSPSKVSTSTHLMIHTHRIHLPPPPKHHFTDISDKPHVCLLTRWQFWQRCSPDDSPPTVLGEKTQRMLQTNTWSQAWLSRSMVGAQPVHGQSIINHLAVNSLCLEIRESPDWALPCVADNKNNELTWIKSMNDLLTCIFLSRTPSFVSLHASTSSYTSTQSCSKTQILLNLVQRISLRLMFYCALSLSK